MRSIAGLKSLLVTTLRVVTPVLALGAVSPATAQEGLDCFHPVRLGVNGENAPLARDAHFGWERFTLRWSEAQPTSERWDFSRVDGVVDEARARGLQTLAILSTAPQWAGSNVHGTRPPEDVALWRAFVAAVAARYRGRITAYEVWNEPNHFDISLGVGWARDLDDPPRYIDYLRIAAEEIRAHAPGTLVIGPATSSRADSRTARLFSQLGESFADGREATEFVDAISFHANALDDETVAEVEGEFGEQLNLLSSGSPAYAGKPVWITELGWKSNRVGELGQRDGIAALLRTFSGRCDHPQVEQAFLFQISDLEGVESRGLFRVDGSAKLIVPTFLATLPFPAAARHPLDRPISAACAARLCTLEASEWTSNPFAEVECRWDYGDGAIEASDNCRVTHLYGSDEVRRVELTVTILGVVVEKIDALIDPNSTCFDLEPPRAEITFPRPNTDLTGTHSVRYNFRDNLGFSRVELRVDGQTVVSRAPPPFQLLFETDRFPSGTRQLEVALTDTCGNRTVSAPVPAFIDRRPPTVSLLSPTNGEAASGRLVVEAEARDNRKVERVELFVDGRLRATDTEAPYQLFWHSAFHAPGRHRFTARAFDLAGNRGDAQPVSVVTDNQSPLVSVASPSFGATVSGLVRIAGWALDATGVTHLRFELDGAPLAVAAPLETVPRPQVCAAFPDIPDPRCPAVGFRTAFDATPLAPGPHLLTVSATDGAGLETVVEVALHREVTFRTRRKQ